MSSSHAEICMKYSLSSLNSILFIFLRKENEKAKNAVDLHIHSSHCIGLFATSLPLINILIHRFDKFGPGTVLLSEISGFCKKNSKISRKNGRKKFRHNI